LAIIKVNNEFELLKKVSDGDEKAFSELFLAYHHQLGEYIFLFTHSKEITEEVVQDVFVKIWQNRRKIILIENFTGYLFIITKNLILNKIRKSATDTKLRLRYDEDVVKNEFVLNVDETEFENEMQILLDKALNALPTQQKVVFSMRINGVKNPEIASLLNISVDSVKKYQQLALRSIKIHVKTINLIYLLVFYSNS